MLRLSRIFVVLVCTTLLGPHATGQQPECEPTPGPSTASPASTTPFSSLELAQKLANMDADDQYQTLADISPRGLTSEVRREIVSLLIPFLEHEYPDIRARAASTIGLFGTDARIAIAPMLKRMDDTEKTMQRKPVWSAVSQGMVNIGPIVLAPVLDMLRTANGPAFYSLSSIVADLGDHPTARQSAPFFIDQLKNGAPNRLWASMFCLSKLGAAAKPAIPEYIRHLDHEQFNIQVVACRALAALGSDSHAAMPKLIQLTKKPNVLSARTHAAMCLGAIGPRDGNAEMLVQLLTEMIAEPNAFSQERGLIGLGRLGGHAQAADGFVTARLDDPTFSQRPEAALALWQISGDAERSLSMLLSLLDDPTYDYRVANSLLEMGEAAAPATKQVLKKLLTQDSSEHLFVAKFLLSIRTLDNHHVEKLLPLADQAPPDIAIQMDAIIAKLKAIE